MIEKIRAFVEKHWDMVSYLFFGVLTTAVNYLVYLPLYNLLGISAAVSNIIAWVAAVAFAYVTNKPKMSTVRSISTVSRPPDAARQPTNLP